MVPANAPLIPVYDKAVPMTATPDLQAQMDAIYEAFEADDLATARTRVKALMDTPAQDLPADAYGLAAMVLSEEGTDLEQAETYARHYVALEPDDSDAQVFLGDLLAESEKYEEARTAYQKALEMDDESIEAKVGLAEVLTNFDGAYNEAEALYRKILDEDGEHPLVLLALGDLLSTHMDREADAKAVFDRLDKLTADMADELGGK